MFPHITPATQNWIMIGIAILALLVGVLTLIVTYLQYRKH